MPVPTTGDTGSAGNTPPSSSGEESPREVELENGCRNGSPSPALVQAVNGIDNEEGAGKPNKLFVGGLSWQTSEGILKEFFEDFGEVTECSIMKDPVTKRSRGFGFVTFKEAESVEHVLEAHEEELLCIDEKTIDPKVAVPPKRLSNKVKRIFVGGLSSDSTEVDLREYFEQFGKVVESQLMYDRNTNRHRGFGFVTFESEEPAEKVCSIQYHDIKGKKVEVKVAQTKEALAMQGRGRMVAARNYASYGYPAAAYAPFYPPQYHMDMLMGGYSAGPMMMGGGGAGKLRGKGRNYSPYGAPAFAFAPGYMDHRRMNGMGGYYQTGYGGLIPGPGMMRGHPMDHSNMIPTSSMDYLSEHFQGMAFTGGYPGPSYSNPPHSPQYVPPPLDHGSGGYSSNGSHYSIPGPASYSPTHTLSPKGTVTTSSINGFTAQVPAYTGSQHSYSVAQPSY